MQFSAIASLLVSCLAGFASAGSTSTGTADCSTPSHSPQARLTDTPALFDLVSSTDGLDGLIWNNVMFANGSAYIGNVKYSIESEPLLMTGGSPKYAHTFTSFHSAPTGWRTFYVLVNESAPVGFTMPHSGSIPAGAQYVGFGVADGNLQLDVGNGPEEKWAACKVPEAVVSGTWQIVWAGKRGALLSRDCTRVTLKVGAATECRYPQN
ncbi:hypothetical protein FN846DRAFT_959705 [Sphaerosporella brunnea]|uniref:Uncharacterized protein n=1 Tax=Sphaerosporella brunnea TaxID=1250544 RepID=A0A5J5EQ08_9PEZI|nr:hypothetical protein FN846DRAFT_959705 [Sphaerosporella brunnea]